MSIEDVEKLAIEAYHERNKKYLEDTKLRRKQHLDSAFADLQGKLPGLIMDEENDCFYFAGRKCQALQSGRYLPGGQQSYCLELERGEYISSLASFGEYLLRKK